MLVLSRKINEKIRIDSDIVIEVLSIGENQIKIGIKAPKDCKIYRDEIYQKVKFSTINASRKSKDQPGDNLSKFSINKLRKE